MLVWSYLCTLSRLSDYQKLVTYNTIELGELFSMSTHTHTSEGKCYMDMLCFVKYFDIPIWILISR